MCEERELSRLFGFVLGDLFDVLFRVCIVFFHQFALIRRCDFFLFTLLVGFVLESER